MENFENIRLPWPDWKIVKYLGGGAYGKVYEIERNVSGVQEKAALKIVSRPKDANEIDDYYANGYDQESIIASYENEIRDYVQEYRLMKELQGQSNIVSCDDFTVVPHENGIGGDIFIRMELLTSLQQILKDRMLSVEEIIKLGKDISRALILCESKNIIHRDIKPVNIMVSQFGDFKLGDFGVSKIMDHETHATVMGTPEYEAPEIMHMEKYGQAVDIYSLGITLYWLLNNRRMPFIGADEQITPARRSEAMEKRYAGKEKLPKPKNGSKRLKEIVLKACEYDPANRYASAQEMYDALDALRNEKPTVDPIPVKKPENTDDGGNGSVTVGRNGASGSESDWNGGGQTQGNSWVENGGTIGKPGGPNGQNKDKDKGYSEVPDPGTVGVKDAYKKQKKKAEETKEVVAEEQGKKKTSGLEIFVMFYGVASVILLLFAFIGNIGNVIRLHSEYRNSRQEFLYRKGLYEIGVSVFIWLGLLLAIILVKTWNASKNVKIIGLILQVHAIITPIVISFEEIYLHSLGKELDTSDIISIVIAAVICGAIFWTVAYFIRGLLKELTE